jgi:hypothetical protein
MRMRDLVWMPLAALLLASSGWQPASAQAPRRIARLIGDATVPNGLGVNVHFAAGHADTVARIRDIGFRVVRTDLLWAQVERQPGVYDWAPFDALVADLRVAGLVPLLILDYSNPLYATPIRGREADSSKAFTAPARGEARSGFMRYARAAALHYGSDVIWEIWNEPDLNFGDPIDLDAYVDFAIEACKTVREVSPDAPVIGPAASGFAWRLLRTLLSHKDSSCFDAISVHPYRDRAPDDVLGDWASLATMVCPGRTSCLRLVSSEWGYSARGGEWSAERQADYVLRSYLLNLLAGVPVSILYDWQNDGPSPDDKESNFGLLDYLGRPKPAFDALRTLVAELDGLRLMGRVELRDRGKTVLAFGDGIRPSKLVGWSTTGDSDAVVPAGACVLAGSLWRQTQASDCPVGAVSIPARTPLRLTGRPSVVAISGATAVRTEAR